MTLPWAALAGVCGVVFLASAGLCVAESPTPWWTMAWRMQCPAALRSLGAAELAGLWMDGGWWRVVSTGFVHGSGLHLALNMWSLLVVGPWASRAWGHARALGCFAVSSVGGVLASVGWAEAPVVVGASAGILGLAGGLWVSRGWGAPEIRGRVEQVSTRGLGITLALMVGIGFIVPMIAQAGHLGGLAFGCLVGGVLSRAVPHRLRFVGWGLLVLGLLGVGLAARAPRWRSNFFAFQGYRLLDEGRDREAVPFLRQALSVSEDSAELENGVAYALAEAGVELDEAERLVERALEKDAANPDFLDTKGWVLCRKGDADGGLDWIRKASEASGGSVPEIEEHLEACAAASVVSLER